MKIFVFGRLAEIIGTRQPTSSGAATRLFALRDEVFKLPLAAGTVTEADIRMSINQVQVFADQDLSAGDEVAFFPVFSGG